MSALTRFPLLLLIFDHVNAIPWNGPRPTGNDELGVNWSPRPTAAASSPLELFRRAGQYPLNVCGFVANNVALPATCSSGSTCVWFSDLSVIGCCTTSGSQCTYPTACLDGGSPSRTPDGNDPLTMTCPNKKGSRECYTNSYPQGYTEVGCGYKSWATTVGTNGAKDVTVIVTYKAANPDSKTFRPSSNSNSSPAPSSSDSASASTTVPSTTSSSSDTSTSPSESSSSTTDTTSSSGAGTTSTSSAGSSSTAAAAAATAGQGSGSGSNVGAIAGGAVGGVVVAAVAAILLWFLIRRRRRRRDDNSAQAAWAQSPGSGHYEDKDTDHNGTAELSPDSSPATMHTAELDSRPQRISELYGRQIYRPYRPPETAVELPTSRM